MVLVELDGEIQRLRDWRHDKVEPFMVSTEWRLKEMERLLREMGPKLDRVARADEIAEAVSQRMGEDRTVRFTHWQRLGGFLLGMIALGDLIANLIR